MPTTRKRKTHNSIELNGFVLTHLELGDCLIPAGPGKGCYCGLRDHDGNERDNSQNANAGPLCWPLRGNDAGSHYGDQRYDCCNRGRYGQMHLSGVNLGHHLAMEIAEPEEQGDE